MEGAGRTMREKREIGREGKKDGNEGMSARYLPVCAVYFVKISAL